LNEEVLQLEEQSVADHINKKRIIHSSGT
jgi:hypothetical protein